MACAPIAPARLAQGIIFASRRGMKNSETVVIEKGKISNWANFNQVEMHVLMS